MVYCSPNKSLYITFFYSTPGEPEQLPTGEVIVHSNWCEIMSIGWSYKLFVVIGAAGRE